MSAVSNQLPYKELKPFPNNLERFPRASKIAKKVAFFAVVFFISQAVGAAITFGTVSFTMYTGIISSTVISTILALASTLLARLPSNLENYRHNTLRQMRDVATHPRMHKALSILEDFFYYPFDALKEPFHHHFLHNELSVIGDLLDRNRPDIVEVWKKFLESLKGAILTLPDGQKIPFNADPLQKRFEGQVKQVNYSWLSRWSGTYLDDLKAIEEIGKMSFGKNCIFSQETMQKLLAEKRPSGIRIARDKATNEVLGYGFYYTEYGVVHVAEVARRPSAARLRIGEILLYDVLKAQTKNAEVDVIVRSSNPFARTLREWGFIPETQFPNYFEKDPPENGLLMKLDWEEYKKKEISQQ